MREKARKIDVEAENRNKGLMYIFSQQEKKTPQQQKLQNLSEAERNLMNELYDKYDEFLAKECPYCGNKRVDWIFSNFNGDANSWKID